MDTLGIGSCEAIAIRIQGQVQGVGFRPFIWQLARDLDLRGEVLNDAEGVLVLLAQPVDTEHFIAEMHRRLPPLAQVDSVRHKATTLDQAPTAFTITASQGGKMNTRIAPDTATCDQCRDEILDPANRRRGYPFTNCTHCGPRFTIIKKIPYDRPYTAMADFPLCPDCRSEYEHPADRRFHAQPNACPVCGPKLSLLTPHGELQAERMNALDQAIKRLNQGEILAIKALGGYHLAVDASNSDAIERLRQRKHRPAKPFALMVRDLEVARRYAEINDSEAELLTSGAAPIVLLRTKAGSDLATNVAPEQSRIGLMLPSNPLQILLMQAFDTPLVMTSGNASGKPPCTDDQHALSQLGAIADALLMHNRDIVNRADDSIARVFQGRRQILRRARGYVPTPITLPTGFEQADGMFAYGPDLKNTLCFLKNGQAMVSPHLGDLADPELFDTYRRSRGRFADLFQAEARESACDAHPGYHSHRLAQQQCQPDGSLDLIAHHHAHLAACLVDNDYPLDGEPVLGLVLDGLGWGEAGQTKHQLWGAEILKADYRQCQHLDGLPAVALMGGDRAASEPWRNLLAHLDQFLPGWEVLQLPELDTLQARPLALLRQARDNSINSPLASSAGRLFDALAALLTPVHDRISFEGQAAMALEAAALRSEPEASVAKVKDLEELWKRLLQQLVQGTDKAKLARRCHQWLAQILVGKVSQHAAEHGISKIALSGGVMQNGLLLEYLVEGLELAGLEPLLHGELPANDGGIAVGQAVIAWARKQEER